MGTQYVASLSYGKDSIAMLHVITEVLKKPLTRIVTAEVWANDSIPAELPPMVEFKDKADRIIKERFGIEVEHFTAVYKDGRKKTYDSVFHQVYRSGNWTGRIYGFPMVKGQWCNKLKTEAIKLAEKSQEGDCVSYVGIAADEKERVTRHSKSKRFEMPLVEAGWTEAMCRQWCVENDLLSPQYQTSARGGCWFCHFQGIDQLRKLRHNYPELWGMMLQWDNESQRVFRTDGRTIHDLDKRFQLEDEGYMLMAAKFKWEMLDAAQMNIMQFL